MISAPQADIRIGLQDGTPGQVAFYEDDTNQFPAMVSGFGGGKTFAGLQKLIKTMVTNFSETGRKHVYVAMEPDMPMVERILLPTLFDEILDPSGLKYFDKSGHPKRPRIEIPQLKATILLMGGNLPKKIVGFNIAGAYVDEAHLMPQLAWTNLINRLRDPHVKLLQIWATFTPEIPSWCHEKWGCMEISGEPLPPGYAIYNSSARDNYYLPDGYIDRVIAECEEGMETAVVDGHFVVSASGRVYVTFEPKRNISTEAKYDPRVELDVTLDFNPGIPIPVAALLCQVNGPNYNVVGEIAIKGGSVERVGGEILERYQHLQRAPVRVFGDATGGRSTSIRTEFSSLIEVLSEKGYGKGLDKQMPFTVPVEKHTTSSNPSVADTCAMVRTLLCNAAGYRSLYVNPQCKRLIVDLRSVIYAAFWAQQNGKVHGGNSYDIFKGDGTVTHASDALRYWIWRVAPKRNAFRRQYQKDA